MENKDVLTDAFNFEKAYNEAKSAKVIHIGGAKVVSFPKSTPKKKKTMKDYAERAKYKRVILLKSTKKKSKPSVNKIKLPKEKSRSQLIKILDKMYSDYLKNKSKGICFKCGRVSKNAGVSHYFSRKYMGGRWDNANCDWACWSCHFHQLEHFKQLGEWYYNYMIKKLTLKGFVLLEKRTHAVNKFSAMDIRMMINTFNILWQ